MLSRRHRRAAVDTEEGSVIMAMMVVMVATFAIIGVLVSVEGGLNSTRNDQNRTSAFQVANGGIDQALYRLDSHIFTGATTQVNTTTGLVNRFSEQVTTGNTRFNVTAVATPNDQEAAWTVTSVGTDIGSGRQRKAVATVTAARTFENGFFTYSYFALSGNQSTPVAYDSSVPGCADANASCELGKPVPIRIGTNDRLSLATATSKAFIDSWEGFNMYGRAEQAAADYDCDTGRCGTAPKVAAITNAYDPQPLSKTGLDLQTCPPVLTNVTIPPGDYNCVNVDLAGNIKVGAPLTYNGRPYVNVRMFISGNFSVAAGARVNEKTPTPRFQVYQTKKTPGGTGICDAQIWGVLFTPGLDIACTGSHEPEIYGTVVAHIHGGTGDHFGFHWDRAAQYSVHDGKYVVKNWRECPVSQTC